MISTIDAPNRIGTQAPSSSLSRLAEKKIDVDEDKRRNHRQPPATAANATASRSR